MTMGMRGGAFRSFAKDQSVRDHHIGRETARRGHLRVLRDR